MNESFRWVHAPLMPTQPVLKGRDYAHYVKGARVLERAEHEIAARKAHAEAELDAHRQRIAERERERAEAIIERERAEMHGAFVRWAASLEQQAMQIVIESIERLLGHWERHDLAQRMLEQALRTLRHAERIEIFAAAPVCERLREHLHRHSEYREWLVVRVDEQLPENTFRIESAIGVIELDVDATAQRLLDALTASVEPSSTASAPPTTEGHTLSHRPLSL